MTTKIYVIYFLELVVIGFNFPVFILYFIPNNRLSYENKTFKYKCIQKCIFLTYSAINH